ncbi:hypothetical protein BDV10DRAFT_139366 [Aspergillus recurvatus]
MIACGSIGHQRRIVKIFDPHRLSSLRLPVSRNSSGVKSEKLKDFMICAMYFIYFFIRTVCMPHSEVRKSTRPYPVILAQILHTARLAGAAVHGNKRGFIPGALRAIRVSGWPTIGTGSFWRSIR